MGSRLLQYQEVGFAKQGLGQSGPSSLAAAGPRNRCLKGSLGEAQPFNHPVHPILVGVPAQRLKFIQQLGIVVSRLVLIARARAGVIQLLGTGFQRVLQPLQPVECGHNLVFQGADGRGHC